MTATDTAPALGRAFNCVKKIMSKRDPVAELAKALEPVLELMRHWKKIEASHKVQCDVSKYIKYRDEVQARFNRTQSPRDQGELWLAGKVLENAQQQATEAQRVAYYGTLETEWLRSDADLKAKVIKAVTVKIEAAKAELETVRAEEQSRIGLGYNANESPIVKRQAGLVATWEQQLNVLNTRMVLHDPVIEAQRFLTAAKLLLEGDENLHGRYRHNDDGGVYELVRVDEINDPDLAEFEQTHHLRSATNKTWSGTQADFEKCFTRTF